MTPTQPTEPKHQIIIPIIIALITAYAIVLGIQAIYRVLHNASLHIALVAG